MVAPDGYLPQPAFYQGFVEGFKVGTLLHNVILQFIDAEDVQLVSKNGKLYYLPENKEE